MMGFYSYHDYLHVSYIYTRGIFPNVEYSHVLGMCYVLHHATKFFGTNVRKVVGVYGNFKTKKINIYLIKNWSLYFFSCFPHEKETLGFVRQNDCSLLGHSVSWVVTLWDLTITS